MDISVSRLNKRMALQLPAEFPLGLVFVVGKVHDLRLGDGEGGRSNFYISENGYMLRCQLTERALDGISLNEGDLIRAGGHLAFDTLQADYFLLARDIEVLPEHRPSRTTLAPILADIKKRSQAASLVPAELPDWVHQIAPPEIREMAKTAGDDGDVEMAAEAEPAAEAELPAKLEIKQVKEEPVEELLPGGLTNDLVKFLSEAMDSPEDVELTHDMVADLAPAIRPEQTRFKAARPREVANARPAETRIPWAIVLVIVFFLITFLGFILLLAVLAAR